MAGPREETTTVPSIPAPGAAARAEVVMFDCDGVLVDSETLIAEILVEMANDRGGYLTLIGGLRLFQGIQLELCAERISAHLGRDVSAEITADYHRQAEAVFRRRLAPVAGVEDLIRSLAVPSCVVSNSSREKMLLNLEITRLSRYFQGHMYSAAEVPRWKPAPDVYLCAAAGLGVDPARCVAIEDSTVGVQAAARAGMTVIGFGHPGLRHSGARWTCETMSEVQAIIRRLTENA